MAVPRAEGLAGPGDILTVRCQYQPAGQTPGGYLQARAAAPGTGVQQTCGLHFAVTADERAGPCCISYQYVNW